MKIFFRYAFVTFLLSVATLAWAQITLTVSPTNPAVVIGGTSIFSASVSSNGFCGGVFSGVWQHNGTNILSLITVIAGDGTNGYEGDGGLATEAKLNDPNGITLAEDGTLYIADGGNNVIRMVTTNGIITTIAGLGTNYGSDGLGDGGPAMGATFNGPSTVAIDQTGNLYISDIGDNDIRKIGTNGIITVFAGNGDGGGSADGLGDGGPATNAILASPTAVTVDIWGNVYIADHNDEMVRKVDTNGTITIVAGSLDLGYGYGGDNGLATEAQLASPNGLAVDGDGNLYISDSDNNLIRKVDTNGIITTVAGAIPDSSPDPGTDGLGDGNIATNASLNFPNDVGVDHYGNLFIADFGNNVIREVDSDGIITAIAGTQIEGVSTNGGSATNTDLNHPSGVSVSLDKVGDLFIGDPGNNEVQMIDNVLMQDGILALYNVTTNDAGSYRAIINSPCGSVTSSPSILAVGFAPVITVQPPDAAVAVGANFTNRVTVTGTVPFHYQWYSNSIPLVNATNTTLEFHSIQTSSTANYYVFVTNLFGAATSSAMTLNVDIPPFIFTQPMDVVVDVTSNATFSVTPNTAFTEPLTFQWLWNGNPLPGATSSSLTLTNVQATNGGCYSVIVSNVAGTATSDSAWLIAQVFDPSFTNNTDMQINNGYDFSCANFTNTTDGRVLEMTASLGSNAASAFLISPVTLVSNASFSAYFTFRITKNGSGYYDDNNQVSAPDPDVDNSIGGDGITFVVQTLSNTALTVAGGGGQLGYYGLTNSLAVVFDTWYNTPPNSAPPTDPLLTDSQTLITNINPNGTIGDGNHVGVVYDGYLTNAATFRYGITATGHNAVAQHIADNFNNTNLWYAWIDYNGANSNLEIRISETNSRPPSPQLTNMVNLLDFIRTTNAYFGFTAGTGDAWSEQDLITWQFTAGYHPMGLTNSPPQAVQIVSPIGQTLTSGTNTVITATNAQLEVGGPIRYVAFYDNENFVGFCACTNNSSQNLYQCNWTPITTGTHILQAVTVGEENLYALSAPVTNSVVGGSLTVQFTTPINGQLFLFSPTNILLAVNATNTAGAPITSVTFTNVTQSIGLGSGILVSNSTYQLLWQDATNGIYAISVTAKDSANNVETSTITITNNAMPVINILSPTNFQSFSEIANVAILASASDSDGTITNVQFYTNSITSTNLFTTLTSSNEGAGLYGVTLSNLYVGNYPLIAMATDNRGVSSVSKLEVFHVISTNLPPTVVVTSPTNNEIFADAADFTITATATATSGAVVTNVEFYLKGQDLGGVPNAPYELTECCWKPGTYQLMAIATDNYGSKAMSSNIEFTVTQPPLESQGYWDPIFVQSMDNYFYNVISNYSYSIGYSLNSIGGTSQTVYATSDAGVFSITDGTNWQILPFPGGESKIPEPTDSEWESIPYQALLVDGTNIYVYGPTNSTFTLLTDTDPDGTEAQHSDQRLFLKTSGNPITLSSPEASLGIYLNSFDPQSSPHIYSIIKFNGSIYVGGNFVSAGPIEDTNIACIAEFDSTNNTWEPVGNGLNGTVAAMTVFNGNLYIGGSFTNAGGNTNINYIARLAGNIWTNVGTGVSIRPPYTNETDLTGLTDPLRDPSIRFAPVKAFAICGSNLYVGGQFTTAGSDTNAHGIAVWNGENWHGMNGGPGVQSVYCTVVPPDSETTNFYWPPVNVDTISVHGNELYVGGNFSYVANEETNAPVSVINLGVEIEAPYSYYTYIIPNGDPAIVQASCVAKATWSESDQKWHWGDLDNGVINTGVGAPFSAVDSSAIIPGPDSNSYDLYVGSGRGPDGTFYDVGSQLLLDRYSMARWRIGFPPPPSVPTVTITNPVNYFVFTNNPTSAEDITVAANVSSGYTLIANDAFFVDGILIAPINNSVFSSSATVTATWTVGPGGNDVGPHILTASASDDASLVGVSSPVIVDIKNPTNTITAVNDSYAIPANSTPIVLQVLTNDIPSSGLKISNILHPATTLGVVAINYTQTSLTYTPLANQYGTDIFYYTVTNAAGAVDSAAVTITILPQPQITINSPLDQSPVPAPASPLIVTGRAVALGAGNAVTNVTLSIISSSGIQITNLIPINGNFTNNWTNSTPGFYTFIATGTDSNGVTNVSAPATISLFNSNVPPSIVTAILSNLNPSSSSLDGVSFNSDLVVTQGIFDLQGQAEDSISTNPVSYQVLLYQPEPDFASITTNVNELAALYAGTPPFANVTPGSLNAQGFHSGSDNSGDLGNLNLSGVPNGVYEVVLTVRGGADETNTMAEVQINTTLKIGQFSFSEQDLSLPVNGIPITITRTYNSQNPNSTDFGYGWTFALNSMNVQLDEQREEATVQDISGDSLPHTVSIRTGGGWDVTLTLPNGQQTTFNFVPQNNGLNGYQAKWAAPAYVHATLQPYAPLIPNVDTLFTIPHVYWAGTDGDGGNNAPIQNQDFPGWVLTTSDGTQYQITRSGGHSYPVNDPDNSENSFYARVYGPPMLTKIAERSGDSINISSNSISHADVQGHTTATVTITRDGNGRITAISDPNGTNGLSLVQYVYNQDTGNLIQVLKLQNRDTGLYATNLYDYNNPNFPHYITSIENADGVPVTRNFYDSSGKLIAMEDANGNTTQYIHNLTNSEELIVNQLGRTNIYAYDANGNIIAQTNALGQITLNAYDNINDKTNEITFHNGQAYTNSYSYDTNGYLLSSTDPLGHTNGFTYNSLGETLTTSDARGNTTLNYYDGAGELIGASDALGDPTTNFYNDGLLVGSTGPIGTTTTNYYDQNGDLTNSAMLDASGVILSSNTYTYDANLNRQTSTVWRHMNGSWVVASTTNIYDAQNRVTQTINPDGGINTVAYNLLGQQAQTIDPLGHVTTYAYDALGRLIQTTYPDSNTMTSAYDAAGNRTNSADQLNHATTYVYDALNRITNTIYADNTINATIYDDLGRVAQTIDARGTITATAYDAAGRRTNVVNAFGISSIAQTNSYTYDANGNQITYTDANGHSSTNVYDPLNRQVQTQYPDGSTTETIYDSDGRSIAQTNQDGFATWFTYDGSGRLIAVTNALGQVTRYQYDEAGNQTAQMDALLRTNFYAYDGQSRRISHTMPGGQSEYFSYDMDGNRTNEINFNGASITNQYDLMNRLVNVSSVYGYNVSFQFSATGQRTNMVDPSGTNNYSYDIRDRLSQKHVNWKNGPSATLSYTYDINGNVSNLGADTSGGVTNVYQYDPLNRLTNVLANGSVAAAYAYDLAGNLQAMRYGNGVTNQYQYDSLNRLTNSLWKSNTLTLASFYYQLERSGNRTNLSEVVGGANRVYSWQYDNLYRLVNETFNASSNITYSYDAVGNRMTRTSGIGVLTNQSFSFNTNDWLSTDTYDSNGNTVSSAGTNYEYDVMNHVTNTIINGSAIIITYDGDGLRQSKKVGSTTTYYLVDDLNPSGYSQVLEERTVVGSTTNLSSVYNYGLDLISQRQPNTSTNYFIFDGHGSTRLLVDPSGNTVNVMTYDAYGSLIASNSAPQTADLYCGQQYDSDLGLYLNRARYLNPNTGRFWTMDGDYGNNEDSLSLHKYLYAENNPVSNIDPSGRDVYKIIVYGKDDPFGVIHHRMIVGDDGKGGSYTLEKGGNGLDPIRTAYITYKPNSALTAPQAVTAQTGGESGYLGYIAGYIKTSQSVDSILNQSASNLDGKPVAYILYFNDCGTFANEWLAHAEEEEAQKYKAYPYFPPSTGGMNYIYNFKGTIEGLQ